MWVFHIGFASVNLITGEYVSPHKCTDRKQSSQSVPSTHTGWEAQMQRAASVPTACFPSAERAEASQVPCKVDVCMYVYKRPVPHSWGGTPKEAATVILKPKQMATHVSVSWGTGLKED